MSEEPKKKRGRPVKSAADKLLAKAEILQSAIAVFDRRGEDPPVEEILREAAISRATFYKYFPSKARLQEELLEFASQTMLKAVEGSIRDPEDELKRIEAGIDAFLRFQTSFPRVYRVLLASALRPGTAMYRIRQRSIERFAAMLSSEVARAGRPPVDPLVFRALIGAVEATSTTMMSKPEPPDDAAIARARAVLIRMFAATLGAEDGGLPPLPGPVRSDD